MRLLKYIRPLKILIVFALLTVIYFAMNLDSKSWYSFFQHPYITMATTVGFWVLIFPFDLKNTMFTTRFRSMEACRSRAVRWLSELAALYLAAVFAMILVVGLVMGDEFSAAKIAIYLICTMAGFVATNVIMVFFSTKVGGVFAKIFLFCLLFAGFAANFAGGIFPKINFMFFNINTEVSGGWILPAAITYAGLSVLLFTFSFAKDREP